ncbi:hypothetical protein [Silvanigrella sp.]|jgi:hypothetical protein|uniref:hypothetical protein n=1 Tax=Silvanigrella sp. TaxID=2024976 RepID=UPI0037C626A5
MQHPFYMQLNVSANEANRLYWNGQYFSLEIVMIFPKQLESKEDVQNILENGSLVLKLTPFKNQFRAKMLANLADTESTEKANIIGLTISMNLKTLKVIEIQDSREIQTTLNQEGTGTIHSGESNSLKLTDKEKLKLSQSIEKLANGNLLPHLRQPFVSFEPEFLDEQWQERIPKRQKKSALIPFQAVFPHSGGIERFHEKQIYAIDDLYCVNPECDCNEVTCVVLTFDPKTGREITHGGFKYHLEKKIFKNIPNFPSNFNSQEWFKQFNKLSPVNLSYAFETRYQFLRNNIKS